ncbi:ABC transporter substrate-binding protein [Cellulomonas sp. Root485]|uniref:metal ABC transporter substrate-binding protein n=1 Tax=Cellulomonas sp. Root485 TaxID=1736546 RepID=UPI0006F5DEFB|nr:metal ABC transporter substrate-binding protein [Cellulomonas sp. Root485]KQY25595.1 ABC transporter substrate-binding protein [Cellulomonas sp. Root485]
MSIARRHLAVLAALPLVLTGCASASGTAGSADGAVQVMASFYPLQFVAEQVGGDRVSVQSMTPPGAEPHDVELSPAQVSRIDTADLVVYLSGFQAAVDDAIAQTSPAHVVDAASDTTLMSPAEEHHEDETEAEHEEHEHGDLDPHFWLDPSRVPSVVQDVADTLTELDPDGAETFAANAAALTQRFEDLDAAYATGLAQCDSRTFVTTHEAFGYLADRYDLEQVGISGVDPEAEPSPARLAAVEKIVRDEGVTTIFFETLVSPKVAETLAADLGVDTAVLDPIEGLADPDADYFSIAEANLAALRVALSCS